MPVPTRSVASSEPDTYSLMSQATTTMTIGDSLPAQLVRKSAKKGFTFNTMSVGFSKCGKTTLLSSLFGKNLEIRGEENDELTMDSLNVPISIDSKTFEIDEKKVRLKLTVAESKNYEEALDTKNTHMPLVDYIDLQFADYHKRESSVDRRNIPDKMIHCLFFFISPFGHGLSPLDFDFLKAVNDRVNIIPIIAKAELFSPADKAAFKRRVKADFKKHNIQVYQMPDPEPDDTDEIKRCIKEIQETMPFAICSIEKTSDYSMALRCSNNKIDPYNKDHSDFLLLKTMLQMQIPDLRDTTHDVFYENYRLRKIPDADL